MQVETHEYGGETIIYRLGRKEPWQSADTKDNITVHP